jgi:hypothetical protein
MQAGMTFEITGPFRGVMTTTDAAPPETEAPIASPVDTLVVGAAPNTQDAEPVSDEDSGSGGALGIGIGVVVAAAAVGGVVAFRKRRIDEASGENTGGS